MMDHHFQRRKHLINHKILSICYQMMIYAINPESVIWVKSALYILTFLIVNIVMRSDRMI